jgi:hypothetical protein
MKLKRYGNILAALVVLAGTAVAAPAACQPASPAQEARTSAGLLRDIRMDARQVRAHAWQWAMLTKNQSAFWSNFDRQWNEIKPPVEDMSMKLVRLENMRASLPASDQKAIDASKPLIADIARETHGLRMELDRYYNDLSIPLTPASVSDARVLAQDAGRLVRTVGPPEAAPAGTASPAPMTKTS